MTEDVGSPDAAPPPRDEIERLRAENLELKEKLASTSRKKTHFWRTLLVWILVVLACFLAIGGALSTWVRTTTLDTDTFVGTVAPLVKNEAVSKAVSSITVQELFKQYDIAGRIEKGLDQLSKAIEGAVPPDVGIPDINLSFIAGPISGGLESFAKTVAQKILSSDQFFQVWEQTLRLAHTTMVNIIRGNKNAAITSTGDTVVLDVGELLKRVKDSLVEAGLGFLNDIEVPKDLGQIELFTSEQLGAVKSGVRLLDLLSWVLPLLAFVFFAVAVAIAADHRRTLMGAAIGLAIAMLVTLIVLRVAHNQLIGQIKDQEFLTAANVVWGTTLSGLKQALYGLFALGVVIGATAAVAGPYGWAVWLREHTGGLFAKWRERRKTGGERGPVGAFIEKNVWLLRVIGLVVAVLVLVALPNISGLAVIIAVVVLGVYMVLLELLR